MPEKSAAKTIDGEHSWMPDAVLRFYAKFPLVVLPGEKVVHEFESKDPVLWVKPTYDEDSLGWASSDPTCLRMQLLFLLRGVTVQFRPWENLDAVPEGVLPALQLPSGELLASGEIRPWLEKEHPLPEDVRALNGMPSQEAHTTALAHSHLILQKIFPAYATLSPSTTTLHLPFPLPTSPIPLSSSIYYSIPRWLRNASGAESRNKEKRESEIKAGVEGIRTVGGWVREGVGKEGWYLGAKNPSPLDALLASHIYPLTTLPEDNSLRIAMEQEQGLKEYVERVMRRAGKGVRGEVRG